MAGRIGSSNPTPSAKQSSMLGILCRSARNPRSCGGIQAGPSFEKRQVHNGWPVLFTHGRSDLIQLFSAIVTRVPSTMCNWSAFLALGQHANWNDEFLSAAVEWAKRTIELLLAFRHMNAPGSNATKLQMYICGFWDDPSYHRRGRMNPRVADEIAALALCCRTDNARIGREVLPLVREFYSLSWCVSIDSADAVQMLIAKVRSMPRNVDWCNCYPFTANLYRIPIATSRVRSGPKSHVRQTRACTAEVADRHAGRSLSDHLARFGHYFWFLYS